MAADHVTQFPARSQALPETFLDPIPGVIAHGSFNLLAGASGVGKTCLLSWMISRLQAGLDIFTKPTNRPAKIGFICADRGVQTARYWFSKVGPLELVIYSLADDMLFQPVKLRNKPKLPSVLGELIDKLALPPGSLVIVDPVALFMGGNLNDYQSCAVACIEIRRLCTARKLTLIGTAHAAKQKADKKERYQRLQDRINGSGAQLGYGDAQMYLASPEETGEKHYTFLWHSHTAPPETFPLGRDKDGLFVPWSESMHAEQENQVYQQLPSDGSALPLATLLGLCRPLSDATVFRRLQELQTEGLIEKAGPGQYRRLSKPS